ncbi:steroid receptor RNA activator 1-like [Linepithema humile]|uniref:steroid receptor RNA activator 1-like n=1 Tax=Linepithema humile TaxID=83485 RepID=UPI0006236811|nr:PREDICTED: steroid receptor RNA activator 1-like [Linepithema humile]
MEQASSLSSPNNTVSSQKSLPSSHDSGWNDPPEWALSSQHSSSGIPTKRVLNKRVAFPLSSQTSSEKANPSSSSNMPPIIQSSTITTAPHKPLVTPIDKDFIATTSMLNFDKDQALTEVLTNLECVMKEHKIESSKVEEIQRRLDIMKSDWQENRLKDVIQSNILDISKALLRKDVEQADKIHIALMMQHATICRTWIPAIRHIIFELKNGCENLNILQAEPLPLLSVESKEK